jgi:cytochrome c-type biogenesis protein CcmH/NrfF
MVRFFFYYSIMCFFVFCQLCWGQKNTLNLTVHQKERAENLYHIIRCPVCDGQSLAGSDADIAQDLRIIIKQKIINNISDAQIKQDLVQIYGADILFEPPKNAQTFLLNYGLWIILLIGFIILIYRHYFYLNTLKVNHNANHADND